MTWSMPRSPPTRALRSASRRVRSPPARSSRSLIQHVRDRPGHDRRYCVDSSKLRERLGFSAATTLAAGLAGTVQWYLANDAWWRPILSGEYRDWYARQYPDAPGAAAP